MRLLLNGKQWTSVFSLLHHLFGAAECVTASSQKWHSLAGEVTLSRGSRCACDIIFCCGKKALHQPADCAHCLPLCDFTACVSELGDLQKHINCVRHQCQHADCLYFHSWCRGQFGGKLFPALPSELWLSSLCMRLLTHTDHTSLFVAPVFCSVQFYILCPY